MTAPNIAVVSLDDQIAQVNRDIAWRLRTNSERVAAGKVSQRVADRSLDVYRAIFDTLQKVKAEQEPKA